MPWRSYPPSQSALASEILSSFSRKPFTKRAFRVKMVKMNKERLIVAFDTSNYTTSLSLVQGGEVVSNVRRLLTVKHGEKGLRQSDAVFLHIKALPELARKLFDNNLYCPEKLFAVGVSSRPRDAEGSYMPCFLAGVSFAEAVSGALKIPLFEFSHQAGHISAAVHSCKNREIFEKDSFFRNNFNRTP